MSKEIKISIKNKQLAESLNLDNLKNKLIKKKDKDQEEDKPAKKKAVAKTKKESEAKPAKKVAAKKTPAKKVASKKEEGKPEPVIELKNDTPIQVEEVKEEVKKEKTVPPRFEERDKKPKKLELRASRPVKIKRSSRQELEQAQQEEEKKNRQLQKQKHENETSTFSNSFSEDKPKFSKKPLKSPKELKGGYQDLPPLKRGNQPAAFDSRSRQGLVSLDEGTWQRRKRKRSKATAHEDDTTIRPSNLKIRLPITIKALSAAMKLKSSQLITFLFKQGLTITLNDYLSDETSVQLIGDEFNCQIEIDTQEQDKIQITDKTLSEEISETEAGKLTTRPPVVTFMGHVDHGKTSLIDCIRKSNRAASEAGDITQHIGAFQCKTKHGQITILDTPGHEAFSAMRSRGANVTDIVVLVVAGDEGIKDQTVEALNQAKEAKVTIIVAINKSDKENFNPEPVYRVLSEHELVPEQWGGSTIMVNCSAKTGDGVSELLELIALQSEVLELKANPSYRARGTVLESEIHKGLGSIANLIVQNGTLNIGDAVVFDRYYARIKTMINDLGKVVQHAGPSSPVEITGISGLPEAGSEFIVVSSEKEAKEISEMRAIEFQENKFARRKSKLKENFLEQATEEIVKKSINIILRADVQGSLEALKHSLEKIDSKKIEANIINEGVGEVTESDIQLAKTSGASIIGFHTRIESHAEELMKSVNVTIKMPKVIYEAVDLVKELMINALDKVAQENDKGKLEVKAIFKASRIGKIAGCSVSSGLIQRTQKARLIRDGEEIWKGSISSLKREKEDVKEVKKGMECGVVLDRCPDIEVGDIIETFEVTYHKQSL